MKSFTFSSFLLALLSIPCLVVGGFAPVPSGRVTTSSSLSMAKFDKKTEKWIATTEDEKTGGYGPFGTLIR